MRRRCFRKSSGWCARRNAVARPSSGSPIGSRRISFRPSIARGGRSHSSSGRLSGPSRAGACARQCGGCSHHRLSLRSRPRDAHVDHGRRRAGRHVGRAVQERGSHRSDGKVDTLVVDKTGTLTEGKPKLVAVEPEPAGRGRVVRFAASAGAWKRTSSCGGHRRGRGGQKGPARRG